MRSLKKDIFIVFVVLFSIISHVSISQSVENASSDWLLLNPDVQLESNDAINDLYNFKFEKADSAFQLIKKKHPNHPLAFFLMGLSEYWRIVPDENNTSFDAKFYMYMDSAIVMAEKLQDKNSANEEANFFLAAAHGFKGRVLALRGENVKAAWAAKQAYHYLNLDVKNTELSPEFLFGVALYNYFREWIPSEKPIFKSVMWAFSHGDKKLGITQLNQVSLNAFYTRTEAQYYLFEIYMFYAPRQEPDSTKNKYLHQAFKTIKYLHETYPDNSYFHRMYARLCYELNYLQLTEKSSLEIVAKYNKKYFGYNDYTLRYASWYLGEHYMGHLAQYEKASQFFELHISLCEKLNLKHGYYIYCLEKLAKLAEYHNNYDKAIEICEKIIKKADKKSESENNCIVHAKQNILVYKKKKEELKK